MKIWLMLLTTALNKKSVSREVLTFKGATKLYPKIVFVSATKIDENVTNILNCCFPKQIQTLAHQAYKCASHKEHLLALLFFRNVKKTKG